jgi:hypothetical protein
MFIDERYPQQEGVVDQSLSALHDPQEERRRAVDLGADAAPQARAVQYWVLGNVLAREPLHDAAHGFA